jgi:hypothetical protein
MYKGLCAGILLALGLVLAGPPLALARDRVPEVTHDGLHLLKHTKLARVDAIKKELAQEFRKVFIEELQTKGGYQVVDEPGQDVLLLRPAIIDLDIQAPDPTSAADVRTYSASAGQMTLVAELYDSVTGDIILRAIDPKAGASSGLIQWQDSVSNLSSARRILQGWADRLRKALDEAHGR